MGGAVWTVGSAGLLAGSEPWNVGNRRQLLFDDRFVQQASNVQWLVHPPRKTVEHIVVSEPEWPLGGYHCVVHHGGRYHLWYSAGGGVLYARSADGIHWEKPALNLATNLTPSGIRPAPNLVLGLGVGGVNSRMHGLMVFVDPNGPVEERFKLVANPEEFRSMVQIFVSPDGLHWHHRYRDVITFRSEKPHHLDSQNVMFWDDRIGK